MRSPRFEPGSSAWQADVLDQTRLRPRDCVKRYGYDGKIVSLLLNLKSQGRERVMMQYQYSLSINTQYIGNNDKDGSHENLPFVSC